MHGKTLIIKSLLATQIIHKAKIIAPPQNIINEINCLIFKFLWHPNPIENISRKKFITNLNQGGLNMLCIDTKFKTCRVERIKELIISDDIDET